MAHNNIQGNKRNSCKTQGKFRELFIKTIRRCLKKKMNEERCEKKS